MADTPYMELRMINIAQLGILDSAANRVGHTGTTRRHSSFNTIDF